MHPRAGSTPEAPRTALPRRVPPWADAISGLREAAPEGLDDARLGVVARLGERSFEVGDDLGSELPVGLGPRDDLVEAGPRGRELLGGAHPGLRGRRQESPQPG